MVVEGEMVALIVNVLVARTHQENWTEERLLAMTPEIHGQNMEIQGITNSFSE